MLFLKQYNNRPILSTLVREQHLAVLVRELVCFDNYSCQYLKDRLSTEVAPAFSPFCKQRERETSSS